MVGSLAANTNYLVTLQQGSAGGLTVQANAAAQLRLQIENRWQNILEALGFDTALGQTISAVATGAQIATGVNFLPVWATSHVWRGSSGIELSLEMRFDAWNDALQDVTAPLLKLVQMFSPKASNLVGTAPNLPTSTGSWTDYFNNFINTSNNYLSPPGPTPKDFFAGTANQKTITAHIGNVLTIENLIPVNLGWMFENRFVANGDPICALVTATFISYTLPTQEDIIRYFNHASGIL